MIRDLLTRYLAAGLGVLLLLATATAGYQTMQASAARAELATYRAQVAEQIQTATTAARTEERRRTLKIQEASDAELLARQAAEADAGRARSAIAGLRQRADQLAARCTSSNPAAAPGSPPASAPGALLADMLGRVAAAAGELGGYADRARGAGQLCERSYDALK